MDTNRNCKENIPCSIVEYADDLAKTGDRIFTVNERTYWVNRRFGAMMRIPNNHLSRPEPSEIRRIFWCGPALIIDYIQDPDNSHRANSFLYICKDQSYSLNKLSSSMKRNVRRGLKELEIVSISAEEVLAHGLKAFCNTRLRNGLSDGTEEEFKKRFTLRSRSKGHVFLGAWKEDKLAGFLSITEVDDWAEIEGSFSQNAYLKSRPNDTLMYSVLSHYLTKEKRRMVTYGVSSVQNERNVLGLHAFKIKVGFEAKDVHRAFVFHPLLRPLSNKLTLFLVNMLLRILPGNPPLNKISGMLSLTLDNRI